MAEEINKFSIHVIGDYDKLFDSDKSRLDDRLKRFVSDYGDIFSEGVLTVDVRYKKGQYNKGKYRRVPLIHLKMRFSTDKGVFVVSKENWGLNGVLHDAIKVLNTQIRDHFWLHPRRIVEGGRETAETF